MIDTFRNLFRPKPTRPPPAIPAGQRVYAVGDIHGCHALFAALVEAIERDDAARGSADTTIVLLGDLIDRGSDSAAVLAAARALQRRRQVRIIGGNHEEMFLQSFDDLETFRHFLRFGGRETILSYPVDEQAFHAAELSDAQNLMRSGVPAADRDFIEGFEDVIAIGDYLFVHAGIRPGTPHDEQRTNDLRWIREPFLSHAGDHGFVVVHGHTITPEADFQHNRVGVDTGAYLSGRLTALSLEGTSQWLIEASFEDGIITTTTRSP
jgi:serine/threonine protein phosphatase 1